jgi:predicted small lipoprotein YifL
MKSKITSLLALLFLLTFAACDEDGSTGPLDPDVQAPKDLKASSADQALNLSWTPSISEGQENFGGYQVRVQNQSTNQFFIEVAPKGNGYNVSNLDNGTMYVVVVRAVTTSGKESNDFVRIEWAPAIRRAIDAAGQPIRVYATTSTTFNSAVDLFNADGKAEVIPQSGAEFRERGDLYVFAESATSGALVIRTPSAANNKGLETQFSSVSYDADDLDEQTQSTAPAPATYTRNDIAISAMPVALGKVIYGRLKRGTDNIYFRLLITRDSNGRMVRGSGNDRYLEMVVSYQHIANVPFAKQ